MAQVNMERVERVLKNLEASHADAQILINDPWSIYYLTLIVLTLYLNGIFHHHYSIIVLIADCTALYLPSFECAAKQVIKYAFPSFSYRTTML